MLEYALLILGIGLVVYNGAKLLNAALENLAKYIATRNSEIIKSLEEKDDGPAE